MSNKVVNIIGGITLKKTAPPEKQSIDEKIKTLDKKQLEKLSDYLDKL